MAEGLIAAAEVPQGKAGTGAAFILGGENLAMKQFEKDMVKRDKARAAGAKAKASAIKEMGDFEAVGWHKHSTEIKGMVDDVKKYFTESMVKGKNPMDPANAEEFMTLQQKKGDTKASAEYSKQIKDHYTANMKDLRINSDKYTQESIDVFNDYYEQPLLAQMAAPLPQLEIIEEETPWWEAANKITATHIDKVIEEGMITTSTKKADVEAITKSVEAFLDSTPEGAQAIEDFGGKQEALDYIRDNVVIPKVDTLYKKTEDELRSTAGKSKISPEKIMSRKVFIKKIQEGDDEAIGSLVNRRFKGGIVTSATYEPTSTGAFLNIESRTSGGKLTRTQIDLEDPESFNSIDILITGKVGEPKIGVDLMGTVPEAPEFQTTDPKKQYDTLIGGLQKGKGDEWEASITELKGKKLKIGKVEKEIENITFEANALSPNELTITFKDEKTKVIKMGGDNNYAYKELDKLLRESKIFRRTSIVAGEESSPEPTGESSSGIDYSQIKYK